MKNITIGLMGLAFHSGNLGCSALSYSFMYMLEEIAAENGLHFDVKIIFQSDDKTPLKLEYKHIDYSFVRLGFKNKEHKKQTNDAIKQCDVVFDFTMGDSFTDIYGKERFIKRTMFKQMVLRQKTPLVLGSQTYGPYNSGLCRIWASSVIKRSREVFARDEQSRELAARLGKRNPVLTTDVAFFLPYEKIQQDSGRIHIGLNVSGLLWNGGYTRDNQFGLTVDYREYITSIMEKYAQDNSYAVHLIPHVIYKNQDDAPDNDWAVSCELAEKYENVRLSPFFESPMQAKSYISGMDVFIGARMHATIAAYSSGVAVIPFSYSRKFEGLFGSLSYPYVISGKKESTEDAVRKTIAYISEKERLKNAITEFGSELENKKKKMMENYSSVILNK